MPAIEAVGIESVRDALRNRDALRSVVGPMCVPGLGIRIASELGWVTAARRGD